MSLVEDEDVLQLSVSEDIYNINTTFVVVHGLKSINGAKGFTALIDEQENEIFKRPFFAISSENTQDPSNPQKLRTLLRRV